MAVINIKEGTNVFVPWRIQGIVRNEDRILNYNIHLLEKQNKYLLNCITRDQIMATNRLDKFNDRLDNAARLSSVMTKSKNCYTGPGFSFRTRQRPSTRPWDTARSWRGREGGPKQWQEQRQSSDKQKSKWTGFRV